METRRIDIIKPESSDGWFFNLYDNSIVMRMAIGLVMASIALVILLFVITGCATAKPKPVLEQVVAEAPAVIAKIVPYLYPTPIAVVNPQGESKTYIVAKGDSLWKITAKGGNPFLWPLIWKSNRDQVVDPDWIEPGMDLTIPYAAPAQDVSWAVDLAEHRSKKPQKKIGW